MATESVLGLPEMRPPLLDDLYDAARSRRARSAHRDSTSGVGTQAGTTRPQTRRDRVMRKLFSSPEDDEDEDDLFEDEEFDKDVDFDEEDEDVDEDDEEEETWQVTPSLA
jgi:hypothetical protein